MYDLLVKFITEHKRVFVIAGGALLLLFASMAVKSCYDADVIEDHIKEEQYIQEKDARKADAKVADQRTKDALENETWRKNYNDAIKDSEAGPPSDAAIRLACQRLRRAGETSDLYISTCGEYQ